MLTTTQRSTSRYELPPSVRDANGKIRSVGIELEFAGLDTAEAANVLARGLGGTVHEEDPNSMTIEGTRIGDINVALDTRYAHVQTSDGSLAETLKAEAGALFTAVADPLIPREVVTEPLPITELEPLDDVVALLREAGAGGTSNLELKALALHLNPQVPAVEADTIRRMLTAFALLEGWLRRESDPARLRAMLGYFGEYPDDYVRRLAAPDYRPDMKTLIDDYIDANPTRDRDLDALPLLMFADEATVRGRLPEEKINGRPTFHYRLPDSRVGEPGWSVADAWNRWVVVERLAEDPDRLADLCRRYLAFSGDAESWADVAGAAALA